MKKFYFCLTLLLSLVGATSLRAGNVVTSQGEPIVALSQLSEGQKVLLWCEGQESRRAFVRENQSDSLLWLSRNFAENSMASQWYIWTVTDLQSTADGVSCKFVSERGAGIATFSGNNVQGKTAKVGDTFTITASATGEGLFNIADENGLYFNGQNIGDPVPNEAKMVSWNEAGGNSDYKIYIPSIEEREGIDVTFCYYDENDTPIIVNGLEVADKTVTMLPGEVIASPDQFANYTFLRGLNGDSDEMEFPYTLTEADEYIIYYYDPYAYVQINYLDEDSNPIAEPTATYYAKGTEITAPSFLGYTFVGATTDEGEDVTFPYTVTGDVNIDIVYSAGGLPFVPTTVADGEFAPDTKYYLMTIRDGKFLQYEEAATDGYTNALELPENLDAVQWAFEGDLENGFKIYNKATGATKILWAAVDENGAMANATAPYMTEISETTEPNVFELSTNGEGFNFKLKGVDNAYFNDINGKLKFWVHGWASTDVGSRITFAEATPEMIQAIIDERNAAAEAAVWAAYKTYLEAEGCVGGWTAEQLAEVQAAVDEKDIDAAQIAVEGLPESTIAFDESKSYVLVSALKNFVAKQPGKKYAIYAAENGLAWKELDATDANFHFGFETASDSTYYMVNVGAGKYIGSYRFGTQAPLVGWAENEAEDGTTAVGLPAAFEMVPTVVAPAAVRFRHNYGASIVTLSDNQRPTNATATEGVIMTMNYYDDGDQELRETVANYWRLFPVGEYTDIESVTVESGKQLQNTIFDLSGRRISKAQKGLYIINGKKVLVK